MSPARAAKKTRRDKRISSRPAGQRTRTINLHRQRPLLPPVGWPRRPAPTGANRGRWDAFATPIKLGCEPVRGYDLDTTNGGTTRTVVPAAKRPICPRDQPLTGLTALIVRHVSSAPDYVAGKLLKTIVFILYRRFLFAEKRLFRSGRMQERAGAKRPALSPTPTPGRPSPTVVRQTRILGVRRRQSVAPAYGRRSPSSRKRISRLAPAAAAAG